ncbi:flagellar radial spoke 2 [Prunus dulcis]|uniref:Flagellar radial spoke 2 n=1 Tax=Prunus dulcis TaxID=3755 RepID=A0A5E4EV89_PRUDU|nr:flagellar radial spoke 2 [Prunus dulcis]
MKRIWKTLSHGIPEGIERLNHSLTPEMFEKLHHAVQFVDDWKTTTIFSVLGAAAVSCLSLTVTAGSCFIIARAQNAREKRAAAAAAAATAGQATPAAPGLLGLLGAGMAVAAIVTAAVIARGREGAAATAATEGAEAVAGQVAPAYLELLHLSFFFFLSIAYASI